MSTTSDRISHGRGGRPCPVLRPKYLDERPKPLPFALHKTLACNPFHPLDYDDAYRLNRVRINEKTTVLTSSKTAKEFFATANHSLATSLRTINVAPTSYPSPHIAKLASNGLTPNFNTNLQRLKSTTSYVNKK